MRGNNEECGVPEVPHRSPENNSQTVAEMTCKICHFKFKSREHALCCDNCDQWHHQRCLRMPAAMFQDLSTSEDQWYCPECIQIKHDSTTCYRQDGHSSSSESDASDGETNTTVGSVCTGTANQPNPSTFTMTPALLVITPAPSSTIDEANKSFQSVMPLDQRREWDTSLCSQETYLPMRLEPLYEAISPVCHPTGYQCGLNTAGQKLSFGDFPSQQPLDAVNSSMQLRGSNMLPQSGIVGESITSSFSNPLELPLATPIVDSPKPTDTGQPPLNREAIPSAHKNSIAALPHVHPLERPVIQVLIPPSELLEPDNPSQPVLEQLPALDEQTHPVQVPDPAHLPLANEIPSQVTSGSVLMFPCPFCPRTFPSKISLGNHRRVHKNVATSTELPETQDGLSENPTFIWAGKPGQMFAEELDMAYEKIVFYKQNIFKLPSGTAGKEFIREMTRLLRQWSSKSALRDVAWKCIMVLPALLLQKPSKESKSKDHVTALKRRLISWKEGDILGLLRECGTIQSRIKLSAPKNTTEATSKRFANLMKQGKMNAAVKLLTSSMQGGILNLDTETMNLLRAKHPEPTPSSEEAIYNHQAPEVHPVVFEAINAESIRKAALNTHGGAGPSGVDADAWRHMLVSRNFGIASEELRTEFAEAIKLLCIEKVEHASETETITSSIEAFLASRLIPVDKCPGLRPIGVGEVLRRIAGKVVMEVVKGDIQETVGSVQVCAGQAGGCEAAIHGMRNVFEDEETDAILLIDAANAFNSINRDAMLKNISKICPIVFIYAYNCYSVHARLFVLGGAELKSKEGTTQGDPPAMAFYAIGSLPLIWFLADHEKDVSQVAYADDLSGGGKLGKLRRWFAGIVDKGPLFGYYAEPSKSWLIVKESKFDEAQACFEGTGVNITVLGKKHLGAAIGSPSYKSDFVSKLVEKWVVEIETLSDIAKFDPHAAYTAFTSCIRHRYTFYLRTIPDIAELLKPLEDAIVHRLIPALTEGRQVTKDERTLLSLPPRLGGMGIISPSEVCDQEFAFSVVSTAKLTSAIMDQQRDLPTNFAEESKSCRSKIRSKRRNLQNETLENLRSTMSPDQKRSNDTNQETGASIWLTTLPIEQKGFYLTKREFWDSIHLRYGWPLPRLPSKCACGDSFNVSHALSCKKGGFVTQRHNELRDMTADLLSEVCHDVQIEPILNELTGETLSYRSANISPEARLDVSARSVWVRNQRAFFDIRVFDPNARRYQKQSLRQTYITNEKEKKRHYGERVLQIENGSFTPLVFSVFGGMGDECKTFFKRLSSLLSEKRLENLATVVTWVRKRVCFALLRSVLLCVRGSRHRYYKPEVKEVDMEIDVKETIIHEE